MRVNPSQSVGIFTKLNNAFKAYNGNLTKSTQLQNAYIQAVGNQNFVLGNYLAGLNGAKASMAGYVKALISAKAATIGLNIASMAGNMLIFTAIAKGISLAITAIDDWIHRVEKANEAMADAVSEYESIKSGLESINSELEENQKRMDELLAKEKLTYAEEGELEELKAITQELLLQQDIEERRAEKASKEAAEEAETAINDIKSDFETLTSTTEEVKDRFAELAQGVKDLGKANQSRGKLTTDDYDEFLNLSNQLAELFPQLTKGYDGNGNAILNLSGNVDTIVDSLDNLVSAQQKLANQEILEKMPDVWAGYTVDLDEYNKELDNTEAKTNGALHECGSRFDFFIRYLAVEM